MANVKIVGNAVVLTSELKVDELNTVKKFTKDGLKLKDEKGNEIFTIAYTPGRSAISEYGVNYGEVNAEGYAQASFVLDETVKAEDRMAVVLDNYAIAIGNLKALETYIREAATSVMKSVEEIKDSIEVL